MRYWTCVLVAAVTMAFAQHLTSARSGLITYATGDVDLQGKPLSLTGIPPGRMRDGDVLSTNRGMAELLLGPGVFLRIGAKTAVRMLSTDLLKTRVQLLKGSAIIECSDPEDARHITILLSEREVHFTSRGAYRMDAAGSAVRPYLNPSTGDPLFQWAAARSREVGIRECLSVNRAKCQDCPTNYFHNQFGSGYVPPEGCDQFLGPLAHIASGRQTRARSFCQPSANPTGNGSSIVCR